MKNKNLRRFNLFLRDILIPAGEEFNHKVDGNALSLHDAFSMTFFVAHSLDHILSCSKRMLLLGNKRPDRVKAFDKLFQVAGGRFKNHKFRMVDAINNSFKHVQLYKNNHYKDLQSKYGLTDFQVLKEVDGRIIYDRSEYKFDYCRVILRPILEEITTEYITDEQVPDGCELAYGFIENIDLKINNDGTIDRINVCEGSEYDESDPTTAIDRMIEYCNPICIDCGEEERECQCDTFMYGDSSGSFKPDFDEFFDFDLTFSQISGAKG